MKRRLGLFTATALVVASMVGTGIFTSTGYQIQDVVSLPAILFAWLIGGLTALCGALAYAELAAALPDNGGEYQLMSRIYHPSVGFVAGWSSVIVGFAAPIAAMALAFGRYLGAVFPGLDPLYPAVTVVLALSAVHGANVSAGSGVQNVFTVGKILLVLGFGVAGLIAGDSSHLLADTGRTFGEGVLSAKFAIGLIYVAFAYSGWNAAAYVAGEIEEPHRFLPLSLLLGTGLVTLLYGLLNVVYLASGPSAEMAGVVEVAHVAATRLFGPSAARLLSAMIAVGLVSSIGAMIMTGARVAEAMGQDYSRLKFLTGRTRGGAPFAAVTLLCVVSLALLLGARFDTLIQYCGFTITLGLGMTVMGVFVLRKREPELPRPYRTWGYPWTPLVFGALSLWMIGGMIIEKPEIAFAGIGTIVAGLLLWALIGRTQTKP